MKKITLIFVIVSTLFIQETKAQVTDTLAYLQNIVANKAQYVGQPFSVLYNNLQIQIKFFSPVAAIHYDKNKETSTSVAFYFPQTAEDMYLTYPCLRIYWQPYLNAVQSSILYSQYDGGEWNATIYNFYKNGIILDIKLED
ncbi:MAG: hypothetical protein R2796_06600 [Chitinophagaceae bacterium]|nr:hypothetical protein [Chitinophagaceae bacterium]MCB0739599.1 hypothetical protein [Chitinophagaceae bacterium]